MEKEHIKKLILIGVCIIIFLALVMRNISGCADNSTIIDQDENNNSYTNNINSSGNDDETDNRNNPDQNNKSDQIEGIEKSKSDYMMSSFFDSGILLSDRIENNAPDEEEMLICGDLKEYLKRLDHAGIIEYKTVLDIFPERLLENDRKAADLVSFDEFMYIFDYLTGLDGGPEKKSINIIKSDTDEDVILYGDDGIGYVIAANEIDSIADRNIVSGSAIDYSGLAFNTIEAYIHRDNILHINKITDDSFMIPNAWLIAGDGYTLKFFINGVECDITTLYKLPDDSSSDNIKQKIADIYIRKAKVESLTIKPEAVNGKVLLIDENGIEIEGHDKLELDENFRIYKVYGELMMETTPGILIGYSITDFVIAEGKICAALINEPLKAENIRVVIGNTKRDKLIHDKVELTVNRDYRVLSGNETVEYKAGEKLIIMPDDDRIRKGRISIIPDSDNARIKLFSIERSYGNPEYRGVFEVSRKDTGLVIVNELSLEEYLYSVVPSEMPVSYGTEALMVQAVCARSYAYNQLMANRYSNYGAHVDDSVNCQVYNNIRETDETVKAVKNTYGQVMKSGNDIVSAFYFSTSCGVTSDIGDVWEGNSDAIYYTGNIQVDPAGEFADMAVDYNYSIEEDFRDFIDSRVIKTFDSGYSWYRWTANISSKNISETVNNAIEARYRAKPSLVLTKTENGSFESRSIKSVGEVKDIEVIKRAKSGIITELQITGTNAVVRIKYQTNIRTLFAPLKDVIVRDTGTSVEGMSLLPSAYFYVDKNVTDNETVFSFRGGGYGHGVGMSQNGVKTMTAEGYDFETVLRHYYPGIEIGFLY